MIAKAFAKLAKWTIALILIGFGIVLILQNVSIISLEMSNVVWRSWPVILVLIGLISFSNYFNSKKTGSWKFGSFLIIYGGLLWADNFNYVEFELIDIWKLWPLILIYIGANMMLGKKTVAVSISRDTIDEREKQPKRPNKNKEYYSQNYKSSAGEQHRSSRKHFTADLNFSKDNWEVQDLDLWTGVGNLYFDFSKGFIPNRETKIRLKGYIADIQMKLPENVAYRIYANINMGDVTIFEKNSSGLGSALTYESENYETATKKIDIYMDYRIGDITVLKV